MSHDEIAVVKLMQAKGLRVTDQRLLILDAVCEAGGHTTLGEIVARVKQIEPTIDQSTVYRALDLFCKLGIVAGGEISDGVKVYEIVGRKPHHHLICTVCGREVELPHEVVQQMFNSIRQGYGFTVTTTHFLLEGVCARCAAETSDG